jgi:hypothetical protein
MLRSLKELLRYDLQATDGQVGKVTDFLFDDVLWTIRYLVADTGGWLSGRKVLLPPEVLGQADWSTRTFPVSLTKIQVEESPEIAEDKPVSRQHQLKLMQFYGLKPYWIAGVTGGDFPQEIAKTETEKESGNVATAEAGDPHLRSADEVMGYHIQAVDNAVGHVEDFLIDDENWVLRYMIVDTKNILPGKKVMLSLLWVNQVSYDESSVFMDVPEKYIKNSPEFKPGVPVNREQEEILFDYYGRPKYWL